MCTSHGRQRPVFHLMVNQLLTVEQGVLWASRLWFKAGREPRRMLPAMGRILDEAGVPDTALVHLVGLMSVLAASARRAPDMHCPRCAHLGMDEVALLGVVAAFQDGNESAAMSTLATWLPSSLLGIAAQFADDIASCLTDAGLFIPRRLASADSGPAIQYGNLALVR